MAIELNKISVCTCTLRTFPFVIYFFFYYDFHFVCFLFFLSVSFTLFYNVNWKMQKCWKTDRQTVQINQLFQLSKERRDSNINNWNDSEMKPLKRFFREEKETWKCKRHNNTNLSDGNNKIKSDRRKVTLEDVKQREKEKSKHNKN